MNLATMFSWARVRLTLAYTAFFSIIIIAFSYGMYLNQVSTLEYARELPEAFVERVEQRLGRTTRPTANSAPLQAPEQFRDRFQAATYQLQLELAHDIFVFDAIAIALCLAVSYVVAGLTLAPIERSYQHQRRFLQDVSHELRTPLSVMRAELETWLKKTAASSKYRSPLTSLLEEVDDMSVMVQDVLFLARGEEVQSKGDWQEVNLIQTTKQVVTKLTPKIAKHKIALRFSVATKQSGNDYEVALSHRDDWRRVITILLDNAAKYTDPGGEISVILSAHGRFFKLEVQDTGIGLSQYDQERIFDRFYRSDAARSSAGSGLGLAIAKQVVESWGGGISVRSTEGVGSTFTVTVPRSS